MNNNEITLDRDNLLFAQFADGGEGSVCAIYIIGHHDPVAFAEAVNRFMRREFDDLFTIDYSSEYLPVAAGSVYYRFIIPEYEEMGVWFAPGETRPIDASQEVTVVNLVGVNDTTSSPDSGNKGNVMIEIPDLVRDIINDIHAQNNLATSDPIFVVQEQVRIYGLDSDYSDRTTWIDTEEGGADLTEEEHDEYLASPDRDPDYPEDPYEEVYYSEVWRTVSVRFTRAACENYIAHGKHRHPGELRIYVFSAHHNYEWRAVRDFLMSLKKHV